MYGKVGEIKMVSIFDVANFFLLRAQEDGENTITPLKLQKLCYYAKAWSLTWDDNPLFKEEFEAWAHGPANYELFNKYREYGYNPITLLDDDFRKDIFTHDEIETLDNVWDAYGIYSGKYLENLTHNESPWQHAREGCDPGERCNVEISHEDMKEYYSNL